MHAHAQFTQPTYGFPIKTQRTMHTLDETRSRRQSSSRDCATHDDYTMCHVGRTLLQSTHMTTSTPATTKLRVTVQFFLNMKLIFLHEVYLTIAFVLTPGMSSFWFIRFIIQSKKKNVSLSFNTLGT